jgi:hypothetical protein
MRIFQKVCGGVDMKRLPINLERRRCRISLYRNGWSDEERSAAYVKTVPFEADAVGKRKYHLLMYSTFTRMLQDRRKLLLCWRLKVANAAIVD